MTIMCEEEYIEIIVKQLAMHFVNNEWDDYEYKLDQLVAEYHDDNAEWSIGDREQIERKIAIYLSKEA